MVLHFFPERRRPLLDVPDLCFADRSLDLEALRGCIELVDQGRTGEVAARLEAMLAATRWDLAYQRDPQQDWDPQDGASEGLQVANAYAGLPTSYPLFGVLAGVIAQSLDRLSDPKGLPEDVSAAVLEEWRCGEDFFAASWLSLGELEAFDWSRRLPERWVAHGPTYADLCPEFTSRVLPRLRSLGGPDDVRAVFWFEPT